METSLTPTTDNVRPARALGGFRRRIAARLGPPLGFDSELFRVSVNIAGIAATVRCPIDTSVDADDFWINADCLSTDTDCPSESLTRDADRYEEAKLAERYALCSRVANAAEEAAAAGDIDRLRTVANVMSDVLSGICSGEYSSQYEETEPLKQLVDVMDVDLAYLERLAASAHQHFRIREHGCSPMPTRTMLRCRMSRARRTRRAAAKKTVATSTGDPDPDPEPSGDARARLRSVVGLIEAACVGGAL